MPVINYINRCSVVVFCMIMTLSEYGLSHEVTLTFKDSVTVKDSLIRLSEIASIQSKNLNSVSALNSLVVGNAAPPGFSRLINISDLIMYRIQPEFPLLKIVVNDKKRISVCTDAVVFCMKHMHKNIKDYLDSALEWKTGDWSFEIVNEEEKWNGYDYPFHFSVNGLNSGYSKDKVILNLLFTQGGRTKKIPVICFIKVSLPVIIARHDIGRGCVISAEDIILQRMDITKFAPALFTEPNQLYGVHAVMTINAGVIIQKKMIQQSPDVVRGDNVLIVYNKGRVTCTVQGKARETGVKGEKIWVENSITQKMMRVIIIAKGRVELV